MKETIDDRGVFSILKVSPVHLHQVSFPDERDRPGRRVDHPPPSTAEVKEIVGIYFHSPVIG